MRENTMSENTVDENTIEKCLAVIGEVFGRPVRATDSFFDLNGDSLKALEILVQLEELLGYPIEGELLIKAADLRSFLEAAVAVS